MDDYIKRSDAIHAFVYGLQKDEVFPVDPQEGLDAVRIIPAADVRENVHGEWLSKDRLAKESDYYAHCTICGKNALYDSDGGLVLSDFCPNCGADCRGDSDE